MARRSMAYLRTYGFSTSKARSISMSNGRFLHSAGWWHFYTVDRESDSDSLRYACMFACLCAVLEL